MKVKLHGVKGERSAEKIHAISPRTMNVWNTAALALALVSSQTHAASASGLGDNVGDRIKVELYYESQCPGCREVLTTSFKEAFAAEGFLKMADVTIVPFGNAEETPSNDPVLPYDFVCQHGPSECRYNAVEACALSKIGCPYKAFSYINCIENYDEDRTPDQNYGLVVGACAALTGVADLAADIDECSTGTEGNGLIHENAVKTAKLDPKHTYVPWIVIGGKHDDDTQDAISESLLKYVCENYHGPDKSVSCEAFEETKGAIRGGDPMASTRNAKSRCMAKEDVDFKVGKAME